MEDWRILFDLVRSNGWRWEYLEGGVPGLLPSAAEVLSRPADAETVDLRVGPIPSVLVIFRPMSSGEIDFDVDLRELQGQGWQIPLQQPVRDSRLRFCVQGFPQRAVQRAIEAFDIRQ